MPPKIKLTKNEIIEAAIAVVRKYGADGLSARRTAAQLRTSTHPIFTYYSSLDELRRDVYEAAMDIYRRHITLGLKDKTPFLGVGLQHLAFAREDPEMYKLLFLTKPDGASGGAAASLKMSQDMVRESLMRIYNIDAFTADCYYRDLWLAAFGFSVLIVTDECPYTDKEMSAVLTEMSLALCKAYKEIPGLAHGDFDRDKIFRELIKK